MAALVTLLAGILFDGASLEAYAVLSVLPALGLGSLAWAVASTAMSSVVRVRPPASATFLPTYLPVVLVSGALGPISEPHWLNTLANYLPAEPVIDSVRARPPARTGVQRP